MRVLPDHTLDDCPTLDILVVPGGWGTRTEMYNERLLAWIAGRSAEIEILASVCTGALILGQAGLLNGKSATTHWHCLDWMRTLFPDAIVRTDLHFVQDGSLFTSAGISAGIDMTLKIVSHCFGDAVARATARHMEYPFPYSDIRRVH